MRSYRRVTYEDRCQIRCYLEGGVPKAEIARRLNFDKSTVSREIARNSSVGYRASKAEKLARERFRRCRKRIKIRGNLLDLIKRKLEIGWSPEQIKRRLKHEGRMSVSHEAVYRFIRADKKAGGQLYKLLRRPVKMGKSRYGARFKREALLSIKQRDARANARTRIGDWERDTMYGVDGKCLLVCVDRKTRFLKIAKLEGRKSVEVARKTQNLLSAHPLHTITNDNGTEFRDSHLFKCPIYYCDPYKPSQRGTVENTIGLLRQYISTKTDLHLLNQHQIQELEDRMNMRPRKCLDDRTPYEVMWNKKVALAM